MSQMEIWGGGEKAGAGGEGVEHCQKNQGKFNYFKYTDSSRVHENYSILRCLVANYFKEFLESIH